MSSACFAMLETYCCMITGWYGVCAGEYAGPGAGENMALPCIRELTSAAETSTEALLSRSGASG